MEISDGSLDLYGICSGPLRFTMGSETASGGGGRSVDACSYFF
jgi:hypothetical protein